MEKEIKFYSHLYNNKYYNHKKELERLAFLISKLPLSQNILEVGCGDGRIVNKLKAKLIIGVDFAIEPLKYVKTLSYAAKASNLPFSDNSFDLIICSEVLEHLEEKILSKTLNEMSRVSSHFIVISIPFKEDLNENVAKCRVCNEFFNVHLHRRTFNKGDLHNLFENFILSSLYSFDYRDKFFLTKIFTKFKKITGNYTIYENIICPFCGIADPCKRGNILGKLLNFCEGILKKIFFFNKLKAPKWVICIYKKKERKWIKYNQISEILICPICKANIIIKKDQAECLNGHIFNKVSDIFDYRI